MRIMVIPVAVFLTASMAHAAEGPAIGLASMVQGVVEVRHAEADWQPLKPGDQVHQGDRVKTAAGTVRLTFEDRSVISLAPRSEIELNEFVYKPDASRSSLFKLWGGRMKATISKILSSRSDVRVSTPTAVAGVRGTEFLVELQGPDGEEGTSDTNTEDMTTNVVVFKGSVGVRSLLDEASQEIALAAGQGTGVGFRGPPSPPETLTPERLRHMYRSAAARSRGSLRNTVGSGQLQAASADMGGGAAPEFGGAPAIGMPPIQQQPTDAKAPSSLTIRVRIPGQQ